MDQHQRQFLIQQWILFTMLGIGMGFICIVSAKGLAKAAAAIAHLNIRHSVPELPLLVNRIGAVASRGPGRGLLIIA